MRRGTYTDTFSAFFLHDVEECPDARIKAGMGGVGIYLEIAERLSGELLPHDVVHACIRSAGEARYEAHGDAGIRFCIRYSTQDLLGKMPYVPVIGVFPYRGHHVCRHGVVSSAGDLPGKGEVRCGVAGYIGTSRDDDRGLTGDLFEDDDDDDWDEDDDEEWSSEWGEEERRSSV